MIAFLPRGLVAALAWFLREKFRAVASARVSKRGRLVRVLRDVNCAPTGSCINSDQIVIDALGRATGGTDELILALRPCTLRGCRLRVQVRYLLWISWLPNYGYRSQQRAAIAVFR